jgi:hypothetical protein
MKRMLLASAITLFSIGVVHAHEAVECKPDDYECICQLNPDFKIQVKRLFGTSYINCESLNLRNSIDFGKSDNNNKSDDRNDDRDDKSDDKNDDDRDDKSDDRNDD